jgi:hypothetical protein
MIDLPGCFCAIELLTGDCVTSGGFTDIMLFWLLFISTFGFSGSGLSLSGDVIGGSIDYSLVVKDLFGVF